MFGDHHHSRVEHHNHCAPSPVPQRPPPLVLDSYSALLTAWCPSGTSLSTAVAGTAPRWVRLVLTGQTVTASVSTDGSTWIVVGQQVIALTQTVFAGLAVSSHVAGQLATATFTSVAVGTPLP